MKSWQNRLTALLSTAALFLSCVLISSSAAAAEAALESSQVSEESAPYILEEDISLRGAYEKHFLNSDGSYTAASYAVPVHYKDEATGEWKEIDNTLVETLDEQGHTVYKNRDGLFDVTFAKNPGTGGAHLVTVESQGHTLSWQLVGRAISAKDSQLSALELDAAETADSEPVLTGAPARVLQAAPEASDGQGQAVMEAEKATGALVYPDLADETTDVRYTVTPLMVKEDFILPKAPNHAVSYGAKLSLSQGLTPALTEDGGAAVSDEQGNVIFRIAAPYMTDAAGEQSENVTLSLVRTGNHWKLTVTPDLEWLRDEERVYPVTVDPATYPENNAANTLDTYIYEGSTTSGYATRQNLDRMYVGNRSSSQKKCRALIAFKEMPTIKGRITQAIFTVTTPSGTSTWQDMSIYRITGNWTCSGVTWGSSGGPSVSALQYNVYPMSGRYKFIVTSTVQNWYYNSIVGKNSNNGFMIRYTDESISDYNSLCSSEHGTDTDSGPGTVKPYLEISYQNFSLPYGISPNSYYYIRNRRTGMYLDISGNGSVDGSNVQQYGLGAYPSERWKVISRGDGLYTLENQNATNESGASMVLDGRANSVPGARAVIYHYGSSYAEQKWYFEATGPSMTFRLSPSINPINVLWVQNGSLTSNAPVELTGYQTAGSSSAYTYADEWIFESAYTLNTPQIGQEMNLWCWAACAQMVARTYVPNSTITQSQIVQEVKGSLVNDSGMPEEYAEGACFATYGTVNFSYAYEPLSESELIVNLRKGNPVIAAVGSYGSNNKRSGGHAIVIYGYFINSSGTVTYKIRDPWPPSSSPWPSNNPGQNYSKNYNQLLNAGGSPRWDRTVVRQ